jgi:sulfur relay (sulfurtransferase) DsrC/TusE family protein
LSYQKFAEAYIQPQYTALKSDNKDTSTNFSQELMVFLSQHPEFTSSKSHFEILRYCYDHYINCDPSSRDLSLQEKFKLAGEMAKNFMGIVIGTKK